MLAPGVVLNGRYQLTQRIAAGGMGEVWRGTDLMLHREVAVKTLLPALMADAEFITRFRSEARMMAALRHPGVVQVYDYGVGDDQCDFLVMEYIDGTPLAKRIQQAGRLGPAETMTIVAQVADALQAAHDAGIVHRDVKPSNLLVRPAGAIVLVDFGVARSAGVNGLTGTNVVMGSAHYMAPEQAEGRPVSAVTDVYALGAVAFACLAGRPPYVGDNPLAVLAQLVHGQPPALPADVPPRAARVVLRALAKDPGQRFPSAAALAEAARSFSSPAPVAFAPPPVPAPDPAPVGSRPRRTGVLVAAGALVLALAGAGIVYANQPGDGTGPIEQQVTGAQDAAADPPVAGPSPTTKAKQAAKPTPSKSRPSAVPRSSAPTSAVPEPSASASATPDPSESASPSPDAVETANPHQPAAVCGDGYRVINTAVLKTGGVVHGRVHLLYHDSGKNCVVTMKTTEVGTKTPMSAYLRVQGKKKVADSGSFGFYAGPIRAAAQATCVKWGGSVGSLAHDSPFEHCD